MAQATTLKLGDFIVMLETATPGTYAAPCGFTSRSLTFSKDTNDTNIPDCADEDAPSWLGRDVVALSAEISGEGVLARESLVTWWGAFNSTDSINARVEISGLAANGGGTWTGPFHVTSLEMGAERGGRATLSVTMVSDGQIVRAAAAS